MEAEVKQAFRNRPHLVDHTPGFVRLEVLSPEDNPSEIMLITFWEDHRSYETWHRGHQYSEAHAGMPKGLKLVPGKTSIRLYEHVAS